MASDWNEDILSNIAEVIDSRHKTPVYSDSGYPMVRVVDVNGGALNLENTKRVSDEVYEDFSRGRDPEVGDLVISRVGSYGVVSYVNSDEKFCLGQNTAFIIPKINSRFLYYQLISPFVKWQIEQFVVGAVQKTISLKSIRQFQIKLPPEPEQKAIAHILGFLDDKIELNRQMNETLEAMAQALFKSWFVDFDPVIDNALAAGNTIPDEFIERAEQRKAIEKKDHSDNQSLFPNEFEFTEEMGWIPKGWSIQSFSELAILDTTSVKPNTKSEKLWEHFSIPAFDIDMSPVFDIGEDIKSNKYKVNANAVLVSKLNPETERIWWVNVQDEESAICSTEFMQFIPVNYKHRAFIYSLVRSDYFQTEILSRVTGSTGSRQRAQPKSVAIIDILKPEENLLIKYSNIAFNWKKKVSVNIDQNLKLAKLRETLLPKLMSGELRIPDAEVLVENV